MAQMVPDYRGTTVPGNFPHMPIIRQGSDIAGGVNGILGFIHSVSSFANQQLEHTERPSLEHSLERTHG